MIDYLISIFDDALINLGINEHPQLIFEEPKNASFGDLSTNIAMQLAKPLRKSPRQIAEMIIEKLNYDNKFINYVSIAGAGFINIKFSDDYYFGLLNEIARNGEDYGRSSTGNGKKINVEYVSVNPTGPLHLGHARNAAIGDTIANLYEWLGWEVTREYYFNNAGNQMNNLAKSIYARYMQLLGNEDFPFPDDGYHGDYIRQIAASLIEKEDDKLKEGREQDLLICRKFGEEWCFNKIKATLERMNVHQDIYFNEDSLYSSGKIRQLIEDFRRMELAYDKDGAVWLAFTKLGLNDDRVIVKSTGEPTYRLPDIAYHREKLSRGYDQLVDVFGADHIATVPDVLAGIKALNYDESKVKVIIHQFVTLMDGGQQVKMSKRTGKSYTLDDLLDEVGPDVVRFFLLMRLVSTHLEFDLALAREQSDKNPVFYLQYAHARICSVIDNGMQKGIRVEEDTDFTVLNHEKEIELIKWLIKLPDIIQLAGSKFEPQILADYLRDLAAAFHIFYHELRIIGAGDKIEEARLKLADITRIVLANGLKILGISAPERM